MDFPEALSKGLPIRGYFEFMGLTFYVSRKEMPIGGKDKEFLSYLTIGNVVADEQGQGSYSRFLDWLEANLPEVFHGIWVECIQEERFHAFHLKRGYIDYVEPRMFMPSDFPRHAYFLNPRNSKS